MEIDEETLAHAATMDRRDEVDFLRSEIAAHPTPLTIDQQDEVERLKTMLGQACDIAERIATDHSDKAEITRLRKAAR